MRSTDWAAALRAPPTVEFRRSDGAASDTVEFSLRTAEIIAAAAPVLLIRPRTSTAHHASATTRRPTRVDRTTTAHLQRTIITTPRAPSGRADPALVGRFPLPADGGSRAIILSPVTQSLWVSGWRRRRRSIRCRWRGDRVILVLGRNALSFAGRSVTLLLGRLGVERRRRGRR